MTARWGFRSENNYGNNELYSGRDLDKKEPQINVKEYIYKRQNC